MTTVPSPSGLPILGGLLIIANETAGVIVGVDTHADTHHAAVISEHGQHLRDQKVPDHFEWLPRHHRLHRCRQSHRRWSGRNRNLRGRAHRVLLSHGLAVVEVNRPNRQHRGLCGKSDPIDAYEAANSALAGRKTSTPKRRDGYVAALRAIRAARTSAIKPVPSSRFSSRACSSVHPRRSKQPTLNSLRSPRRTRLRSPRSAESAPPLPASSWPATGKPTQPCTTLPLHEWQMIHAHALTWQNRGSQVVLDQPVAVESGWRTQMASRASSSLTVLLEEMFQTAFSDASLLSITCAKSEVIMRLGKGRQQCAICNLTALKYL
ncbi:IS110 family transposase [Arthrobacter sp. 24S4-2]|uniref:IS110 family transposase n=1 Tax=Arthrobacter sp. 24S4-2 TaxID=2575374 RepID=UPI0010C7D129|nr:IS110 family transposase [Arthrobacter sp. 24S4-2]